ncbi:hypothetical protein M0R45_007659 [Rubus argutus]|uniref:Uncharacterized protein n=1 Tax=Rubus argutus TaxID=59490 RepID=A0AAW1Y1E1_RUBAR
MIIQQKERHLLDRNMNAALQNKIDELQRNKLQVISVKCLSIRVICLSYISYHWVLDGGAPDTSSALILKDNGSKSGS